MDEHKLSRTIHRSKICIAKVLLYKIFLRISENISSVVLLIVLLYISLSYFNILKISPYLEVSQKLKAW